MQLSDLLSSLQYDRSPNFLAGQSLEADPDFGHIFRQAQDRCSLHGAYLLRGSTFDKSLPNVPVVYVCEAKSEQEAREIHRSVWNQSVVPFLFVVGPQWVRLYRGFRYDTGNPTRDQVLLTIREFSRLASSLEAFRAESIDDGRIWADRRADVTPESRVDRKLLSDLERLDQWLAETGVDDGFLSHAIIGKFVYLHYLRQRGILSARKLAEWGIEHEHVFSSQARLTSFIELLGQVENWLNGSVFPLSEAKIRDLGEERLRKIARIFQGETVEGQLHLPFEAYDFSFIPIETLSVIYEQFLHSTQDAAGKPRGKARGAYYTPVPLVNFMLDRLGGRRPLEPGMRVLDPACGSGAFLVQCYRKLIEQHIRANAGERPQPTELRRLLIDHIFGADTDEDACQIAELSLTLTLLEYVDPPDLSNTNFKLPVLRNANVFRANAFADWAPSLLARKFDWIVGNPPWIELKPHRPEEGDEAALQWIKRNRDDMPIGGNQLAEAFAWRARELAAEDGVVGLVLPAMTLFKYESRAFREAFFKKVNIWWLANFSNLAYVLFGGRATLPACAMFYSPTYQKRDALSDRVEVYSPFLANQPAARPGASPKRRETWSIVVNAGELTEIPYREIVDGDPLPWKLAMWGSPLDRRVLRSLTRFPTLRDLERADALAISEGLQLRTKPEASNERIEHHAGLEGKLALDVQPLKGRRYLFRLPPEVLRPIPASQAYVRRRGGTSYR